MLLLDDDYYDGEDDDYYEDDDDYYDEEGGGGGRGVVLALVAALVLVAVGGAFVAIVLLSDVLGDGDGDPVTEGAEVADGDVGEAAVKGTPTAEPDENLLETDTGFDLDFVGEEGGDAVAEVITEAPEPPTESARSSRSTSWEDDTPRERTTPTPRAASTPREAPSERRQVERSSRSSGSGSSRSSDSGSSRSSDSGSSRSSRSSDTGSSSSGSGSSTSSSADTRDPWEDSGSGSSSSSSASGSSSDSSTPAPREGAIVEEETPAPRPSGSVELTYDKESIASLGGRASGGELDSDEVRHLQAIPKDHTNFTLAWATVLKNAEAKRDFKGHCEAADTIITLPQNKYHPEWNLELGKCQMRNGQWEAAVRSVDRTLTDTYGLSAATKVQRLLTAYEVKAVCKTRIYDDNARANSGAGDEQKLSAAIQAWSEYRNYASGVGHQRALQRAEREIADLTARREE